MNTIIIDQNYFQRHNYTFFKLKLIEIHFSMSHESIGLLPVVNMEAFKLYTKILVITFLQFLLTAYGNEFQKITIKSVKCNFSDVYLYNVSCYAKSYSRDRSTVNLMLKIKKPLTSIFVSFKIISGTFNMN